MNDYEKFDRGGSDNKRRARSQDKTVPNVLKEVIVLDRECLAKHQLQNSPSICVAPCIIVATKNLHSFVLPLKQIIQSKREGELASW